MFWTFLLKDLHFAETNNGLDADIVKEMVRRDEACWVPVAAGTGGLTL